MMNRKKIPLVKEILDRYFDFLLKAYGICSMVAAMEKKSTAKQRKHMDINVMPPLKNGGHYTSLIPTCTRRCGQILLNFRAGNCVSSTWTSRGMTALQSTDAIPVISLYSGSDR